MNKKILKILKILTILLILLLIIIFSISVYNRIMIRIHQDDLIYDENNDPNEIDYPFMAYEFFMNYDGEIESDDIVAYVYNVANNIIPDYYINFKNSSTKEIDSFFIKNEEDILNNLGISEEKEFEEFVLKLQQIDSEKLVYSSYQLDTTSIKYTQSFSYFDLTIKYEDDNEITVSVIVRNKISENNTNLKASIK